MGVEEVLKSVVDKLKAALLAVEAWFDGVFPPETIGEKINEWFHVALPFLIAVVVFAVVFCLCRCCCNRGRVKMMKAPGRNCRIPRSMFESDPRGYFLNLRANSGDQLC